MDDRTKAYTEKVIMIGVVIFIILCSISKDNDVLDNISDSIAITSGLSVLYYKWLWRFNPLEDVPKLHKNYDGFLYSTYDGLTRKVELRINQTLFKSSVIMITNESTSKSISSNICSDNDEVKLIYTYLNVPRAKVRGESKMHYGTCILDVSNTKKIVGQYFTDRKSTGDIELEVKLKAK